MCTSGPKCGTFHPWCIIHLFGVSYTSVLSSQQPNYGLPVLIVYKLYIWCPYNNLSLDEFIYLARKVRTFLPDEETESTRFQLHHRESNYELSFRFVEKPDVHLGSEKLISQETDLNYLGLGPNQGLSSLNQVGKFLESSRCSDLPFLSFLISRAKPSPPT